VRVRIVQEFVLTRDAFNARLEIENGENADLEDIWVTVEIRATYGSGEMANSLFSIGKWNKPINRLIWDSMRSREL
jgi:hypothetical protein